MTTQELCAWLREHSSGVYRPAADAADLIERLLSAPASTGRMSQDDVMKLMRAAGIPESHCRTLYAGHGLSFTLEHFTKFANTVLSAPVAARELDVEANRRAAQQENAEFTEWWSREQACPEHNLITENAAHAAWQERGRRARSVAQSTAPVSTEQAGDAWISVEDRLPEEDCRVLAATWFTMTHEQHMDIVSFRRGSGQFSHSDVTHWMPLPKQPVCGKVD